MQREAARLRALTRSAPTQGRQGYYRGARCWLERGYRIELVEWPPGRPNGITRADFV
jgi:hypothetical protein